MVRTSTRRNNKKSSASSLPTVAHVPSPRQVQSLLSPAKRMATPRHDVTHETSRFPGLSEKIFNYVLLSEPHLGANLKRNVYDLVQGILDVVSVAAMEEPDLFDGMLADKDDDVTEGDDQSDELKGRLEEKVEGTGSNRSNAGKLGFTADEMAYAGFSSPVRRIEKTYWKSGNSREFGISA